MPSACFAHTGDETRRAGDETRRNASDPPERQIAYNNATLPLSESEAMHPPRAERRPHQRTLFGATTTDDYFWLRDRNDPAVIGYLEAENAYADASLAATQPLQRAIFDELAGRLAPDETSAPVAIGAFLYHSAIEAGKQYRVHTRRPVGGGEPQLILDQNAAAAGHTFCKLGQIVISPDAALVAYTLDLSGGEIYDLTIATIGGVVIETLRGVAHGLAWANDSRTLFYAVANDAWRTYRIYRHTVGTAQSDDALVYEEPDEAFAIGLRRDRSGRYALIEIQAPQTNETRTLALDAPAEPPQLLLARQKDIQYTAAHRRDAWFIRTNLGAKEFRLVRAPLADPSPTSWTEVVAGRDAVTIDGFELFDSFVAVAEREGGAERLRVIALDGTSDDHIVDLPEPMAVINTWYDPLSPFPYNPAFDATAVRLSYTSLVSPNTVYDYAPATRELRTVLTQQVPGYDKTLYRSERLWASADDGERVPVTLVERADRAAQGPGLLMGYGAYGVTYPVSFNRNWVSLLDRGFVCAIAHVRGGGDLGERWYEGGRVLTKMNTFSDFAACARALVASGRTTHQQLAIGGRSAGGLLAGAVTMLYPDLCRAAIANVPFVDVVNTSLDPSLPLVVAEYAEWGDPNIAAECAAMLAYAPYELASRRDYPAILATAGLNDPRVQYWEPAKWVAKLRTLKTDERMLLLKTEMVAGHAGPSGRYDALRETAMEYAFVIAALGQP